MNVFDLGHPILMAIVGEGGARSAGQAVRGGADLIQVRAKELCGRDLASLVREVVAEVGAPDRVIVNSRADIAELTGACGVQLPESGLDPRDVRRAFPGLLIGVSRHGRAGLERAGGAGADFAILGPVFGTPGKQGRMMGLDGFQAIFHGLAIPILAVGGVSAANAPEILARGARGLAAIRLFADPSRAQAQARELRKAMDGAGREFGP
ncbi:MAG: thiamine phosphate synthase [Vicinamibacteria bacterium]|nr:thiamine phosphate synthase [Vicinamibacteria bacterium]